MSSIDLRSALTAVIIAVAAPNVASADAVFVGQATGGGGKDPDLKFHGVPPGVHFHGAWQGAPAGSLTIPPEMIAPHRNTAESLTVGNFNSVVQIQGGKHNHSNIGILGGHRNRVNVLQAGNDDSNIILINPPPGVSFNLVQPPNSHPLDLLIAHLPNGGWFAMRK
jgi:hypothetical protein